LIYQIRSDGKAEFRPPILLVLVVVVVFGCFPVGWRINKEWTVIG
jgi:hypothetical protein